MENLPFYIPVIFTLTACFAAWLFYRAANMLRSILYIVPAFMGIQAVIALTGFFTVTHTVPPRFLLLVGPPLILILSLFATRKGKQFTSTLNQKYLTLLHIVRVPVELVLFWLFLHKGVPELMTFEGRNFDIVAGITAPVIFYFGYVKKQLPPRVILSWNFICLGLLFNIVTNAVLSAPTPFQKLAFNQPNIAVLYFPFVWLPGIVVPLVLFSHLVVIRQLVFAQTKEVVST